MDRLEIVDVVHGRRGAKRMFVARCEGEASSKRRVYPSSSDGGWFLIEHYRIAAMTARTFTSGSAL